MQFDDDRVDTSHVDDLRGSGGRSSGGAMGGAGGAAAAGIIAMLMRG